MLPDVAFTTFLGVGKAVATLIYELGDTRVSWRGCVFASENEK